MAVGFLKRHRTLVPTLVIGTLILAGGFSYVRAQYPQFFADASNYEVSYESPANWKSLPHSPMTRYLYKHPSKEIFMRGFVHQVEFGYNPTPELDTDGLAKYYLATTEANQKDWTAEKLPDVERNGNRFSVIKRARDGKTVITAFLAKGNTTYGVTMYGNGKDAGNLDVAMDEFKALLGSTSLERRAPSEEVQAGL